MAADKNRNIKVTTERVHSAGISLTALLLGAAGLMMLAAGCRDRTVRFIEQNTEAVSDVAAYETDDAAGAFNADGTDDAAGTYNAGGTNDSAGTDDADNEPEAGIPGNKDKDGMQEDCGTAGQDDASEKEEESTGIYVDVCGAVRCPGVYILPEGSRAYEAILLAGGLTEDAFARAVNQAEVLSDAMQLYIPFEGEEPYTGTAVEDTVRSGEDSTPAETSDGRIDLNTAGMTELCSLAGIGESKASAILAYREKYGPFGSIEELKQVNGIKDGTFEKIRNQVKVD
ncbi:MAG: helix-hairpin-helix domain-containing protein [Blautia sp.]|nr:helix-hairpin-helix domain-containing protein [Blautia sp.]